MKLKLKELNKKCSRAFRNYQLAKPNAIYIDDIRKAWLIIQEDGTIFNYSCADKNEYEREKFVKVNLTHYEQNRNAIAVHAKGMYRSWVKHHFVPQGEPNEAQYKALFEYIEEQIKKIKEYTKDEHD